MRAWPILALVLAAGAARAGGHVEPDPDWPCVQRKVPTLTPAAVWTGPSFEEGGAWADDLVVAPLVGRLSQRRVPLEEAEAEVEALAGGADGTPERLALLFAGLFEVMNAERSEVVEGIERYARRTVAMADTIREESAALDRLRSDPQADPAAVAEAEALMTWRLRTFDDRRDSLGYACEVPRLIEQRLFALGRAIGGQIDEG